MSTLKYFYLLFIGIIVALILLSCADAFRPPPDAYEHWKKKNVSKEETINCLLACGYPNELGEGWKTPANDVAIMHLCMERNGYTYIGRFGSICTRHPNLPACVEARKEAAAKRIF